MANLQARYNDLRRTTIALVLVLLVVLLLSVVAFYKGWLGAPKKIYLSPSDNQYYLRCDTDASICGEISTCEKVKFLTDELSFDDKICIKK